MLWLDGVEHRYLDEVGTMNIMLKIGDEVITPPLNGAILAGITRDSVLTLLRDWGLRVSERPVAIDEVIAAAQAGRLEMWGTGTAAVISPVGELGYKGERYVINGGKTGALTQKLYDTIVGIQYGTAPRSAWLDAGAGESAGRIKRSGYKARRRVPGIISSEVAMNDTRSSAAMLRHSHVFLGAGHAASERRMWAVIWLCGAMMIIEIAGGLLFGSIALVADGLHMSTHAGALLLAALAYFYARKHADDPRFTFGTGKLGDLAGFASAIILAMIALLIGYDAVDRIFAPVPIHFAAAIPIACLGLLVNVASAWLLSGGAHHHGHAHGHAAHDETRHIDTQTGTLRLEIFEDGVPPLFRLRARAGEPPAASIETVRPDGTRQSFAMADRGDYLESTDAIPEPHEFTALLSVDGEQYAVAFEEPEHAHAGASRDHNMRAAVVHVMADAAVSVLVIVGLSLARAFGWLWMDPLAGIVGACVIASWSVGLIRDTGAILLDMNPDRRMAEHVRQAIESEGDTLADLHLWRLGPGHLGAIVSVGTHAGRSAEYYRAKLARFRSLSHLTVEVRSA